MASHIPFPTPVFRWSRVAFTTAAVLIAFAAASCAAGDVPAAPSDDEELVRGQTIWAGNCVNCHGAAGDGGTGSKLANGAVLDNYPDVEEQLILVAEGKRAMPPFGDKLDDDDLAAVVRYTREVIALQG